MGGSGSRGKRKPERERELVDMSSYGEECAEEEYVETSVCCGVQFTKVLRRKVVWENNFITHCNSIREEFRWADDLIALVANNRRPKTPFFREINDLKRDITATPTHERDLLISPSEVDQFKANLKRSVLVTYSQSKHYQDTHSHRAISTISAARQSKIEIARFKDSARGSTAKKLERSPSISSSKSGLRKSIMSFVDDTLSTAFGSEREISRQAARHLEVFLKFSMVLEKHLGEPGCMLAQVKRRFIDHVVRTYADSVAAAGRISELIDGVNQLVKVLKEAIIDYYNLNSFAEGEPAHNPFIANEDNLLTVTTAILFKDKPFYDTLYRAVLHFNASREARFQNILQHLQPQPPAAFYIHPKFCLDDNTLGTGGGVVGGAGRPVLGEPYGQCKLMLNELETAHSPIGKMKVVYGCSEMMNREIERFYEVNGLEREKWVLDADQVLSIFCYIIVGARLPHLHTHLFLLDSFATSSQMISIFGYYLSVMNCAVEQLENDYSDHADPDLPEPQL